MGLVCLAIAIGVLQDANGIPLAGAAIVAAVIDAFGDPDAPGVVDVQVGRIEQLRRRGPDRDFEVVWHMKRCGRQMLRLNGGWIEGRLIVIGFERRGARFHRRLVALGFAFGILRGKRTAEGGKEEDQERAHGSMDRDCWKADTPRRVELGLRVWRSWNRSARRLRCWRLFRRLCGR